LRMLAQHRPQTLRDFPDSLMELRFARIAPDHLVDDKLDTFVDCRHDGSLLQNLGARSMAHPNPPWDCPNHHSGMIHYPTYFFRYALPRPASPVGVVIRSEVGFGRARFLIWLDLAGLAYTPSLIACTHRQES
jgi:hypothetical protein